MTWNPPPPRPGSPPLPGLRLPLGRRRLGPGATLSFVLHAGVIALLVLRARALLERAPGAPALGRSGGGGGDRAPVNFFLLPPNSAPVESAVPAAPAVTMSAIPVLRAIPIDLPRAGPPPEPLPRPRPAPAAGPGDRGVGLGAGGGPGTGLGPGGGADTGPGTGGEAGYIFVASPRGAILPPLAPVPGSVVGRIYRVRFWVSADGRVTQVAVDPPIADADYGREFQRRMMAYRFYPAHTRDGRNVASVITVRLRIGN